MPRRVVFTYPRATLRGVILLLALGAVAWAALLPASDSRGPRYLLWKWGVGPFSENIVYPAMVQDLDRDSLVLGLTESELQGRFPDLRSSQSSLTQEQQYYMNTRFSGQDVRWLGQSQWLVRLEQGRVVSLHLAKG